MQATSVVWNRVLPGTSVEARMERQQGDPKLIKDEPRLTSPSCAGGPT